MALTKDFKGWIHRTAEISRLVTKCIVVAVATATLSGCASHRPAYDPPGSGRTITRVSSPVIDTRITTDRRISSSVIDAPVQVVWAALVSVYEELEIPLDLADPATRRLGNPTVRSRRIGGQRMSRYFECGQAEMGRPRADQYDVTYSIFSWLVAGEEGRTVLHSELDGSARPTSVSTNPIHCSSKGTLEQRIAELVTELVQSAMPESYK